jgi:hypothetical protein
VQYPRADYRPINSEWEEPWFGIHTYKEGGGRLPLYGISFSLSEWFVPLKDAPLWVRVPVAGRYRGKCPNAGCVL